MRSFLKGRDVFVSTGSGKSLCYCLLPYAFDILRRGEEYGACGKPPYLSHERSSESYEGQEYVRMQYTVAVGYIMK